MSWRTGRMLGVALFVGACAGADDAGDTANADSVPSVTPSAAAPTLGDPEIAHVAVTANTIDIEAGEQAKTKAENAEVKAFAQTMITDHTLRERTGRGTRAEAWCYPD